MRPPFQNQIIEFIEHFVTLFMISCIDRSFYSYCFFYEILFAEEALDISSWIFHFTSPHFSGIKINNNKKFFWKINES